MGANLNSLRVHAHLERPEFYDVADELGVMIWQDFPLQWGYTDEPAVPRRGQAPGRRHDRSLLRPPVDHRVVHAQRVAALDVVDEEEGRQQNAKLDEELLRRRAAGRSGAHRRTATRAPATGTRTRAGTSRRSATSPRDLPKERYITEYGAAGPARARDAQDDVRRRHAVARHAARLGGLEVRRFPARPGRSTSRRSRWARPSRSSSRPRSATRRTCIRFQTEVFRRAKWTKNTGLYQFMFVDDWPSITWSVVDYYRRPKLAYATLRDSMQRLLPSIEYDIHKADGPHLALGRQRSPAARAQGGREVEGHRPARRRQARRAQPRASTSPPTASSR